MCIFQAEKVEDVKSTPAKAAATGNEGDDDNGIVVIERTTQAESLKAAPPAAAQPTSPSSTQEPISFDGSIITHEKADEAKLDWAAQCEDAEEAKEEEKKPAEKAQEKKTTPKEAKKEKKPTPRQIPRPTQPVENKVIIEWLLIFSTFPQLSVQEKVLGDVQ